MGNKPSNSESSLGRSVSNLANATNERKSFRRFKSKNSTIDRSTSSPMITKNFENYISNYSVSNQENHNQDLKPRLHQVPKIMDPRQSDRSYVINLNAEMKQKQQDLTTAIKKLDSIRPNHHINSKLYKPNSLMIATNNQNILSNRNDKSLSNIPNSNTLPSKKTNRYQEERSLSPRNVRISPKITLNESNNSIKPKPIAKFAKRLGLSPRFKRKIVETITNRVNTNNSQSNLKQVRINFLLSNKKL